MKYQAKLNSLNFTFDGKQTLTFTTEDDLRPMYDELKDKKVTIEIKETRRRRSIDANAYMWLLCEKIAEAVGNTKLEVYRSAIKDVGVYREVSIDKKAYKTLCKIWSEKGSGWVTEKVDADKRAGYITVNLYYGSSTYNSKQMSRLINNLVAEAKDLDIETEPPEKIEKLIERWGK